MSVNSLSDRGESHNDSSDGADNEQTAKPLIYNKRDMSMGNVGRRQTRLSRTAKKSKKSEDECLSAAEMDDNESEVVNASIKEEDKQHKAEKER